MRISLIGAYGYWNYGDDLLAWIFSEKIKDWVPNHTLIVSAPDNGKDYMISLVGAKEALPFTSTKYWIKEPIKEFKKSDLVIFGGGGILYDYPSLTKYKKIDPRRASALNYLTSLLVKKNSGHVLSLGIGIGPLKSRYSQWLTKSFLSQVDYITVRDRDSATYLSTLKKNGDIVPDSSFILAQMVDKEVKKENKIGIVIRKWSHENIFANETNLKLLFHQIESKTGNEVIPISLRTGEFHEVAGKKVLEWDPRKMGPIEFSEVLASFSVLITMRLHAMNVAACYGVPSIAIGLDPKLVNSAKDLGLDDYLCSPNVTNDEIVQKVLKLQNDQKISKFLENKTNEYSIEVEDSFEKIKNKILDF